MAEKVAILEPGPQALLSISQLKIMGLQEARQGWPTPWVEQASIQTDIPNREVRFDLTDKKSFNEEEMRTALLKQRFKEVTVRAAPEG